MGPTLAMLARRGLDAAGRTDDAVYAVSRFGDAAIRERLEAAGVRVVPFDLIENDDLSGLPDAPNVVFMVGAKFGAATNASWAWEVNAALPDRIARRYRDSAISVLSTGNVYPFVPASSGGADERPRPRRSASTRSPASDGSACSSSGRRSAAPRSRSSA